MASKIEAVATAVRSRIATEVETGLSLAVAWENAPFDVPAGQPWVSISLRPADRRQIGLGAKGLRRVFGIVMFAIYTPVQTGDGRAWELADSIADLFTSVNVGDARFQAADIVAQGRIGSGRRAFWRVTVSAPFYYDEVSA